MCFMADVPDVSSMPLDLAWCVAKQLTARELFDAEQRPDFVTLNLGAISIQFLTYYTLQTCYESCCILNLKCL